MGRNIFAVATAVSAIALAPQAHADNTDDQFINTLAERGISWANAPASAIGDIGRYVCVASGQPGADVDALKSEVSRRTALNDVQSGVFAAIAIRTYCPVTP
ncbi:hypothetical protein BOH72_14000 [Mycobacterium sp. WY10]|nr:hypothetical protein BOH72_14000 [Mycobacterium sp. WY10]